MRISVIMILLLIPLASGLGVAPGEAEIILEGGSQASFDFTIINNEEKHFISTFSLDGEKSKYFTLRDTEIEFKGEKEKKNRVEINIPEDISPGNHVVKIMVRENPKDTEEISAFLTIALRINLFVPYDGSFIRAKILPTNFHPGRSEKFIIEAENVGLTDIESARSELNIKETHIKLESEGEPVPSRQTTFFDLPWEVNLDPGEYVAEGIVYYGSDTALSELEFNIGEQSLKLESIKVTLNSVLLNTLNDWNKELDQAYAEVELRGEKIYGPYPSIVESYEAREKKILTTYPDVENLEHGEYTLITRLNYLGQSTEKEYKVYVSKQGLTMERIEILDVVEKEEPYVMKTLLIILLIIIAVTLMHYTKKALEE